MPETKVIVNKRLNMSEYFQLYLKICTENDFFSLPLQHKNKDYGEMPFGDITKESTKVTCLKTLMFFVVASHAKHFHLQGADLDSMMKPETHFSLK